MKLFIIVKCRERFGKYTNNNKATTEGINKHWAIKFLTKTQICFNKVRGVALNQNAKLTQL